MIQKSRRPPVFVVVPGASQNASHYGYLCHLLQQAGYATFSSTLPSVGARDQVTAEDDTNYIRKRMLEPILNNEGHNVIMVSHSYSGMPASAAAQGFGLAERAAQGKSSAILGQIFIAAIIPKGGDGNNILASFGGTLPPHMYADEEANLLRCDDPKPPLYNDIESDFADVLVQSAMCQGYTSFQSPCPRATWDHSDFNGRQAYIRTVNDTGIPYQVQSSIVEATGQEWILKDMESGHSPQLAQPEKLARLLVELAKEFESR